MDNSDFSLDSRKLHLQNAGGRKDVISKLPDSILLHILSFISTKDAIRTSILARRWKFLWTYLSDFSFEIELSSTHDKETQNQTRNCLLKQVDRLLQKAKYIKRFHFTTYRITVDSGQAKSWISALLNHKIEELDLSLNIRSPFVLTNSFLASESLNMLNLELGCVLKIPGCIHFPSLKTLTLACVSFTDEKSTQQLFCGCPVLQKLTLYNCFWKSIENVTIEIPTITTLVIDHDCLSPDDLFNCRVMIDAVNLLSLSCTSYLRVELVLINLTSLVDAYIDVTNSLPSMKQHAAERAIKLLSRICHVKSLTLSNDTLEILSYAENIRSLLPTFHNLNHICVNWGMFEFTDKTLMDILEKSPNLEVLDIAEGFDPNICLIGEVWTWTSVPHCFKSSLKSFSISNFDGSVADMQLLGFLLKNGTFLVRIEIFCVERLLVDLKKQAEISHQLQMMHRDFASCAIEFQ